MKSCYVVVMYDIILLVVFAILLLSSFPPFTSRLLKRGYRAVIGKQNDTTLWALW